MKSSPNSRADQIDQHAFLSDVFHELSQPLTALHCALELALLRDKNLHELRVSVEDALESADLLRRRLAFMRALSDADQEGQPDETVDLGAVISDVCADLEPLFAASGKRLQLQICQGDVQVRGEHQRIARALFCFLEYLFRHADQRTTTTLRVEQTETKLAILTIRSNGSFPVSLRNNGTAQPASFETEMMRRTFRAYGGCFELISVAKSHFLWQARLTVA